MDHAQNFDDGESVASVEMGYTTNAPCVAATTMSAG